MSEQPKLESRHFIRKTLKWIRELHGFTQTKVANELVERAYSNPETYKDIEKGRTDIKVVELLALADFYRVNVTEIMPQIFMNKRLINDMSFNITASENSKSLSQKIDQRLEKMNKLKQ